MTFIEVKASFDIKKICIYLLENLKSFQLPYIKMIDAINMKKYFPVVLQLGLN